jgi:hypothetical protein
VFVIAGVLAIAALSSALPHQHGLKTRNSRKIKSDLTALHRDLEAVTHGAAKSAHMKPSFGSKVASKLSSKVASTPTKSFTKSPSAAEIRAKFEKKLDAMADDEDMAYHAPAHQKHADTNPLPVAAKFHKTAAKPVVAAADSDSDSDNEQPAAQDSDSDSDDETFHATPTQKKAQAKFQSKLTKKSKVASLGDSDSDSDNDVAQDSDSDSDNDVAQQDSDSDSDDESFRAPQTHAQFNQGHAQFNQGHAQFNRPQHFQQQQHHMVPQPHYRSQQQKSMFDEYNPFSANSQGGRMLDSALDALPEIPDFGIAKTLGLEEDDAGDDSDEDGRELEESDADEGWGLW